MQIQPDKTQFETAQKAGKSQLIYTKVSADLFTPVSAMLGLKDKYEYSLLLESVHGGESRGRYSVIALGSQLLWEADYDAKNALADLKKLVRETVIEIPGELPPMSAGLFGYIGYDAVRLFEKVSDKNPDELGIPDIMLFVPEAILVFDSVKDDLFIICPVYAKGATAGAYELAGKRIKKIISSLYKSKSAEPKKAKKHKVEFTSNCTREEYHGMVAKAKEYIKAGDIFQLVPSQRFTADFKLPPFAFYRALRHLNPSPFLFYLQLKDFCLVGSSPEILVRLRDGTVTIRPIAGTRKRGKNAEEDAELAADLMADKKEIAEHLSRNTGIPAEIFS